MPTTYHLSAHPAERHEYGYVIKFGVFRTMLENERTTVEISNADQLVAHKHAHGLKVLEANPEAESVAVIGRPAARHARGCKDLPTTFVTRDDLAKHHEVLRSLGATSSHRYE
jgi:hypothetical protein